MITNKYQRKYASTEKGKTALAKAENKYQKHNLVNATNYNQRYSKDDYRALYAVLEHHITPHECAVMLNRNTNAINNKVARLRKQHPRMKAVMLTAEQIELANKIRIAVFQTDDQWLINDGRIVGYIQDTQKKLY